MTWLELMDMLDKMPRHLLKREAELWHYDSEGNYEILPVDDSVSPLNDSAPDEEWGPGGDCRLSPQSFDIDRKPKLNEYIVSIHRVCNVSVMARDEEQAEEIGRRLAGGCTMLACDTINEVILNCDDEFAGIVSNDKYCHVMASLDAEDSMRVLNEEE